MRDALFYGSCTALVTPFSNGRVDFDAFGELVEWQIESGTDCLLALGTTGEPSTVSHEERREIIRFLVHRINGRVPLWVGAGANDTKTAVSYVEEAQFLGADAVLVVTPYYNRASREGLVRHYSSIADRAEVPVIVYNVPSRTGVNLLPETFAEICKHPNIGGIKEASGDLKQLTELSRVLAGAVPIYAGNDDQVYPMLALGARGVVSVASNVVPGVMHEMVMSYMRGDAEMSREIQFSVLDLVHALFSEVSPIPVKAALSIMGKIKNELRLPLCPLDETRMQDMRALLKRLKLI